MSFAFYELRSLDGPERQESQESVYGLIEAHYINDLRPDRLLLSLIRFDGEPGVDLIAKVVASSDHRVLRARGALASPAPRRSCGFIHGLLGTPTGTVDVSHGGATPPALAGLVRSLHTIAVVASEASHAREAFPDSGRIQ